MSVEEMFQRLMALRQRLVDDETENPDATQNALFWDVAIALGMTDEQAAQLAGDPVAEKRAWMQWEERGTAPAPNAQRGMEPIGNYDFSESGFGIWRLSADTDAASEALAEIEAREIARRQSAGQPQRPLVLCDCGHYSAFPMSASLGRTCPDCYDDWSG